MTGSGCLNCALAAAEPLDLPPREAVEHFRAKGLHAGFSWLDTDAASHLRSFTVAKAMQLDVLSDIRTAVDRAIAQGTTFEEFQDGLEPLLRKHGWWGRERMIDPDTGESKIVQLGSPRRLRIIFDTNLRMAYARGRWERIERVAEARPYLRYVATLDDRTRDQHRAWHGTVLRWDDPFWRTHYPPNGWFCRCTVQQLSEDDLEDFGYQVSPAPPEGWDQMRTWTNKRIKHGKRTYQVPRGIAPGFQHNVGLIKPHVDDADRLIARIDQADPDLQRAAIGKPWDTDLFRRHAAGEFEGDWPVAVTQGTVARFLNARSSVVRFSQYTAIKQIDHRKTQDFRAEHYAIVQQAIDRADWLEVDDPKRRHNHTQGFITIDGEIWRVIIKRDATSERVYLQSLHRSHARQRKAMQRKMKPVGLKE